MESSFSLPADLAGSVDAHRAKKVAAIDAVLARLPGADRYEWGGLACADLPLRYALAHHVVEAVGRAASAGDAEAVTAALALRTSQDILRPVRALDGPVLVAHPDKELFAEDKALADAPVAIVSASVCGSAGETDRGLVTRALGAAAKAGFGATVSRNSKVVVLIAERRPTDTTIRSWTTNALPATVHLDYFAEHWYVSRDLIHEAAHTELNDLFAAFGVEFPAGMNFFAPWLATERPVFGFLHGAWAFSHVALYSAWLADEAEAPDDVQALSSAIHLKHAEQIRQAREDVERALELVPSPELADLIRSYVTRAAAD